MAQQAAARLYRRIYRQLSANGLRRIQPNMQGQEEDQRPESHWNWIDSNKIRVWNVSHWDMKMGFVDGSGRYATSGVI